MSEQPFRPPRRVPWALLALAAIAVVAVCARYWQRSRGRAAATAEESSRIQPHPRPALPSPQPSSPEVARPAPTRRSAPRGGAATNALAAARRLEEGGDLAQAREDYFRLLGSADGRTKREIEDRLSLLHTRLVFSTLPMAEKTEHRVKPGESVERIARAYGTTPDLILMANGIQDARRIQVGTKLQVLQGRFTVRVSRSRNEMVVTLNDRFFKRYPVGTGKEGSTPLGTFVVADKEKNPTWWHEGRRIPFGHPDNLLGTRWMALKPVGATPSHLQSYGIHGTWDETSIGKWESAGCIRMRNPDVEELFALLPVGTSVNVEE